MVIKRISPLSFAKLTGLVYAAMGLVFGGILSVTALAGGLASDAPASGVIGALVGVGAIVILPILYGLLGFVTSLVGAWFYNVAAGLVGGIELDVQ